MREKIVRSACLFLLSAAACGGTTVSGGNAGSTGGSGSSGSSGGAGSTGSGGGGPGPMGCTDGSVTFELTTAGSPAFTYCVGKSCGTEWLSIKSASGQEMQITHPCMSDCSSSCQVQGCDLLCALPRPVQPAGERQTWNGTFFTPGTCGQGNMCVNSNCAPAGTYVVTMCAGIKNNADPMFCETDPMQQCVDVEFDYPNTEVVRGTIGPIK